MNYFQNIINKNVKRINILRNGMLNSNSPKYTGKLDDIKLPLKDHQLTLLESTLCLEASAYGLVEVGNIKYQSNTGIIADNVGGGKSISVLALISVKPFIDYAELPSQFISHENIGFVVYTKKMNRTILNGNLIIVPHSIFLQWDKYIKKFTNLKTLKVNSQKSLKFLLNDLQDNTIYLVSNTFILDFLLRVEKVVNNDKYLFQRVFVDEADNIKLSSKIAPNGLFNWFITSSVENLIFPSGQYTILKNENEDYSWLNTKTESIQGLKYKNYIKTLFDVITGLKIDVIDILNQIICRNENEYIQLSFQLDVPNIFGYICKSPAALNYLANSLANKTELMNFINANDITALKEKLGFNVESQESISQMLTSNLQKTYNNEIKHYKYIESLDIDTTDKTERLLKINKKIDDITSSIQHIQSRLSMDEKNMCPICRDTLTEPICNVSCCGQLYCMSCISNYFQSIKSLSLSCPCCRTSIGYTNITIISDENNTKLLNKYELPKKEEVFEKLINQNPNSKWLIFSGYDGTFNTLIKKLELDGITFSKVLGTNSHIEKLINDFKIGKIKVLLLNACYFGMGLNLECATDILIYHTLNHELEKQVIGRAQRPGRTTPLNIHLLCHTNEMTIYGERFPDIKKIELL
jgi:hypothetical protein